MVDIVFSNFCDTSLSKRLANKHSDLCFSLSRDIFPLVSDSIVFANSIISSSDTTYFSPSSLNSSFTGFSCPRPMVSQNFSGTNLSFGSMA
uniref:Uncharacterized protein n=1 Tax=Anguilla anguilla TaxID=7936 RepID=A0A0E9XR86_ANGAN